MYDLSNANSQVNMGTRWVIDLEYEDSGEIWTYDLGPSYGTFDPKYGIVRYRNWQGLDSTFSNIQNDHDLETMECSL